MRSVLYIVCCRWRFSSLDNKRLEPYVTVGCPCLSYVCHIFTLLLPSERLRGHDGSTDRSLLRYTDRSSLPHVSLSMRLCAVVSCEGRAIGRRISAQAPVGIGGTRV